MNTPSRPSPEKTVRFRSRRLIIIIAVAVLLIVAVVIAVLLVAGGTPTNMPSRHL